jgi:ArsR family transcriptional regulator, arsenate/arsenite/antimonite-responsive transcriptional repressor
MKTIEMPTATDEQLVTMLRAVANPVRYRILQILAERGECQCGPLGDSLPIAPSTLSQHLKVLREAGLIRGTVDGPGICYCRDAHDIS